jgi:hypothetical protein
MRLKPKSASCDVADADLVTDGHYFLETIGLPRMSLHVRTVDNVTVWRSSGVKASRAAAEPGLGVTAIGEVIQRISPRKQL